MSIETQLTKADAALRQQKQQRETELNELRADVDAEEQLEEKKRLKKENKKRENANKKQQKLEDEIIPAAQEELASDSATLIAKRQKIDQKIAVLDTEIQSLSINLAQNIDETRENIAGIEQEIDRLTQKLSIEPRQRLNEQRLATTQANLNAATARAQQLNQQNQTLETLQQRKIQQQTAVELQRQAVIDNHNAIQSAEAAIRQLAPNDTSLNDLQQQLAQLKQEKITKEATFVEQEQRLQHIQNEITRLELTVNNSDMGLNRSIEEQNGYQAALNEAVHERQMIVEETGSFENDRRTLSQLNIELTRHNKTLQDLEEKQQLVTQKNVEKTQLETEKNAAEATFSQKQENLEELKDELDNLEFNEEDRKTKTDEADEAIAAIEEHEQKTKELEKNAAQLEKLTQHLQNKDQEELKKLTANLSIENRKATLKKLKEDAEKFLPVGDEIAKKTLDDLYKAREEFLERADQVTYSRLCMTSAALISPQGSRVWDVNATESFSAENKDRAHAIILELHHRGVYDLLADGPLYYDAHSHSYQSQSKSPAANAGATATAIADVKLSGREPDLKISGSETTNIACMKEAIRQGAKATIIGAAPGSVQESWNKLNLRIEAAKAKTQFGQSIYATTIMEFLKPLGDSSNNQMLKNLLSSISPNDLVATLKDIRNRPQNTLVLTTVSARLEEVLKERCQKGEISPLEVNNILPQMVSPGREQFMQWYTQHIDQTVKPQPDPTIGLGTKILNSLPSFIPGATAAKEAVKTSESKAAAESEEQKKAAIQTAVSGLNVNDIHPDTMGRNQKQQTWIQEAKASKVAGEEEAQRLNLAQ